MNYSASITDFFRTPKWLPNLLWGALCMLIPIVGPIVMVGWHSTAMFGRREPHDFENYPAFSFDDFGKHLERGVWPFLVNLAASFVMVPVAWILTALPMGVGIAMTAATADKNSQEPPVWLFAGMGVMMLFFFLVAIPTFMLVVRPLLIRAAMTQDFAQAFNFKFIKDFTARTWLEQLVCGIFFMVATMVVMIAGMLVFCVGMYASAGLTIFMMWHLDRQLYDLYLARGGEPVPVSPKLSGLPPPLKLS